MSHAPTHAARLTRLRAERRADAFGVGEASPRLSWRIEAAPGARQTAYEVRIEERDETHRASSSDQLFVPWPSAPLASRERVTVRVRAYLDDGTSTEWSEPLSVEAGLLDRADWRTPFVSPSQSAPADGPRPGYLMRAEFDVPDDVVAARAYVTAHGAYTMQIDGERVGDEELAPGWTSYTHRLRYRAHDLTGALAPGRHAIGAVLTDGWYRGRLGFNGGLWDIFGEDVALLAQLELTLASGELVVVRLDDAWKWALGPVTAASLYDGEHFDARLVPEGWAKPGFDDASWHAPAIRPVSDFPAELVAPVGEPVRVTETLAPVSIERRDGGRFRLDFGQNVTGRVRIRPSGPAGTEVVIRHAEVIEDGELGTRALRDAAATDRYTLAGTGAAEEWAPEFTFHGFRYAEIDGWPGEMESSDVTAEVIHSDMERTGSFGSSDSMLDQLHENTAWSMRDNFLDVPTDCPQRDERLGWTGDIAVFAPAANFLFDSAGVLASWLRDVSAEQAARGGAVPNYVPWVACGFSEEPSAAWGDAAVLVPWAIYERTGDAGILAEQLDSMIGWVDFFADEADETGAVREGFELGDWLDPAAPPEDPAAAVTDPYLVATAFLANSASLLSRTGTVLGRSDVAERYAALAERTRAAFRAAFLDADGTPSTETATALSLMIVFELVDDPARHRAGARLAVIAAEGGHRIQTGFVGTPIICDALASTGNIETAYRLLAEKECPSWLYPITMGATTTWERWDSMLPDGTINPGEMTSFNHYALGAVVDFLHRVVAGLAPAEPGYRRIRIAPRPGGELTNARAALETPYGRAEVAWRFENGRLVVEAAIPTGVEADVDVPGLAPTIVGSGAHRFEVPVG